MQKLSSFANQPQSQSNNIVPWDARPQLKCEESAKWTKQWLSQQYFHEKKLSNISSIRLLNIYGVKEECIFLRVVVLLVE